MQKAYTSPHFLTLSVRFPGKTIVLYIGRGNQYQGLYLAEKMPPSHLRIQDRLLDYIRKNLVGAKLSRIKNTENKMIISFEFRKEGIVNTFYLGWNERHLYFDQNPLEGVGEFKIPNENDNSNRNWTISDYLISKNYDESKKILQKKKEKFLTRKLKNIKSDIEKNQHWREIEEGIIAETIDLSGKIIIIGQEKFKVENCKNEWQKKDIIYKKIKKLKRGEEIARKRLLETEDENSQTQLGKIDFEMTKETAIQPCWPNQKNLSKNIKINTESSSNVKQIKIGPISGIVGLNSSGNDQIRNGANKNFYWFHLEGLKGAHCVLKLEDLSEISIEYFAAIASMLRDLSHLDYNVIPVLFTQLKYVKGVKGSQGKVIAKKTKHISCNYINWKEIITI